MKKLTRNSKILLIIVLVMSGIALFSLMLFISLDKSILENSPLLVIILVVIVLVAIGAVLYKGYSRKNYSNNLNDEYYAVYEDISTYFSTGTLGNIERREVLNDVVGLLIDAQTAGKNVENVTGGSTQQFARRIEESFGKRNRLMFVLLDGLLYTIGYAALLQVIDYLRGESANFFDVEIGVSMIAFIVAIAFVAIPLIRLGFSTKKYWFTLSAVVVLGLYILFNEVLYAQYYHTQWAQYILDGTVRFIGSWIMLLVWSSIVTIVIIIKNAIRKSSIQRL